MVMTARDGQNLSSKCWCRSFVIKYIKIREFTENQRVLFDPNRHNVLLHDIFLRTFNIYESYER